MGRSDPPRGGPGEQGAGWPAHRPPGPPRDDAAATTPRSIHEEDTLDAGRFVRPQQQPAWPGPATGYRQQPPPGWPAPPGQNPTGNLPLQSPQRSPGGAAGLLAGDRRWWVIGAAAAVVVAVIATLVVVAVGDDSSSDITATTGSMVPAGSRAPTASTTADTAPSPTTSAPPPPPVVDAAALPGLLLAADLINQRMNTTGMTAKPPINELLPGSVTPPHCTGAWGPAYELTYNGSGFTGLAVQGLFGSPQQLVQAVVAFPDGGAAKAFYDKQVADWNACQSTHVRYEPGGGSEADLGVPSVMGGVMTLIVVATKSKTPGQQCERDMAVRSNVVVDVRACSPTVGSAGLSIARDIADKIAPAP